MRKFFIILALSLTFINSLQANDIRDFQIGGFSILDSLTKYITKDKIIKKKNSSQDLYKSKDFYSVTFFKKDGINLYDYDELQFHLENNDSLFKIHAVTGAQHISDKKKCLNKMKSAELELDYLFQGVTKRSRENYEHSSKRGYIYKKIAYYFDEGYIIMKCDSWDKDTGIKDGLVFDIYTKKLSKFLNEKAY